MGTQKNCSSEMFFRVPEANAEPIDKKNIHNFMLKKLCLFELMMQPSAVPSKAFYKSSKILNKSCVPKRSRQTGQTQIRLLLKKQSDQGLPCLLF